MRRLVLLILLAALSGVPAQAQFAGTGSTAVSVTIGPEAAIQVDTTTTSLSTTGTVFNDFTGATNFTYKIRTGASSGTGTITLQVTADFSPAGGPSVASPPTAGDTLAYTCTVSSPGTGCSGSQTSSTTASTPVVTFGANARSAKAGNSGSVSWTLTNDPRYQTGSYSATVTLTVSAT